MPMPIISPYTDFVRHVHASVNELGHGARSNYGSRQQAIPFMQPFKITNYDMTRKKRKGKHGDGRSDGATKRILWSTEADYLPEPRLQSVGWRRSTDIGDHGMLLVACLVDSRLNIGSSSITVAIPIPQYTNHPHQSDIAFVALSSSSWRVIASSLPCPSLATRINLPRDPITPYELWTSCGVGLVAIMCSECAEAYVLQVGNRETDVYPKVRPSILVLPL